MSLQVFTKDGGTVVSPAPAAASLMRRHSAACSQLGKAFDERRPVALMFGADRFELGRVIGLFLAGLDERTTVIRLRHKHENALGALREVNRALGFDPKDLTVSDLQNVFTMFLEFQRNHGHRSVLCVERADEQSMWLLDCVARLVKAGERSFTGRSLFVIVAGTRRLRDVLRNSAFDPIREHADVPIRLGPFSVFETREFLRQMSNNQGRGDIQGIFEFDALERLHRISGGIPYIVARLFRESVAIIDRTGVRSASAAIVSKAARDLREAAVEESELPIPVLVHAVEPARKTRRLVVHCAGRQVEHFVLKAGRFMIGRAVSADICLPRPSVSRRHALLIDTGEATQVLDLGGVNGTLANGTRIDEIELRPGMVLALGDCRIEYVVD